MEFAVISDVHSSLSKLKMVLKEIEYHNLSKIFMLGDCVDFDSDPNEVIELLAKNTLCCSGNHDRMLFDRTLKKLHPDFVINENNRTKKLLNQKSLKFLKSLPLYLEDKINRLLFTHTLPIGDFTSYLYNMDEEIFSEYFEKTQVDITFIGHSHPKTAVIVEYCCLSGKISKFNIYDNYNLKSRHRYIVNVPAVNNFRGIDDEFSEQNDFPQYVTLFNDSIYVKKVRI